MISGYSASDGIVHGTPHTDSMEGTDLPSMDADDDNTKEVDMSENGPEEIIDVDTDASTDGEQEDPNDGNPCGNLSKNQDRFSNKSDVTSATAAKDTNKYHADGDNPEGIIKVGDLENVYYGNNSENDENNAMLVDGSYTKCKKNHKENYKPSHGRQQYKQGIIHLQTQDKYYDMFDDDKYNYVLGIIME